MTDSDFDDEYQRASAWIRHVESGELADARSGIDTASLIQRFPQLGSVQVDNLELDGPHGVVPARRYRAPQPRAAMVWVHGGGFVAGDLDMPESHWVSLELAAAGITVVALEYRKALHGVRHPVPSDDVLAGWREVRRRAAELGLPDGPIHMGGASAGANLTAGVAVRLLQDGATDELPAGLVLVYPLLHADLPEPDDELAAALADLPPEAHFPPGFRASLNENLMGPEGDIGDPVAYPALAALAGFPPLLVVNADADELRTSGEAFAALAGDAGVPVELVREEGTVHGYLDHPGDAGAERTLTRLVRWVLTDSAAQ